METIYETLSISLSVLLKAVIFILTYALYLHLREEEEHNET